MKTLLIMLGIGLMVSIRVNGQTNLVSPPGVSGQTVETIVCLRHGEKPKDGLDVTSLFRAS